MDVRSFSLALFAALFFPAMALSQTVTYNYARGVNFGAFDSYNWITIEGATAAEPVLDRDVRQAVEAVLSGKHLAKSESSPRLLIAYQISDEREKEIQMCRVEGLERYGPGWHYGSTYGYRHGYSFIGPSAMSTATEATIPVGNLVLDVYDRAHGDLVWRGEVSKALSSRLDANSQLRDLHKAVAKLLEAFP